MQRTNYFIEGLQGAGKSTFVQKLSEYLGDYQVFHEGDYSPVELAWCAYATEEQYQRVLSEYPSIEEEIQGKTVAEGDKRIICYTQILTDIPGFHKKDGKPYKIIYLDVEDVPDAIDVIRKECSDNQGNELWFPMMVRYLEESPLGKACALKGLEGLLAHLEKRKALELRIIGEIFGENAVVLKAKGYEWEEGFL